MAQTVKNLPTMPETWVQSLGQEDPLEEGMAIHWSLAWRIPRTEESGGLQSKGSRRVRHDWAHTYTQTHTHTLFINYVQISYLNLGLQIQLLVGFYSSLFRSPKPNPPPTPIYIKVIRGHRWHRTVTLATFLHAVFTKWNNITWILLF